MEGKEFTARVVVAVDGIQSPEWGVLSDHARRDNPFGPGYCRDIFSVDRTPYVADQAVHLLISAVERANWIT
ncbi:hypothetical protein GCM10020255_013310 [Rhodococcus baikonurensis]